MRVLLVTGLLGAGKTTFINALISQSERRPDLAVLVNDFGKEDVFAEYGDLGGARVLLLENGCICCVIGPSLIATIKDLIRLHKSLKTMVIELNGIARPDLTKQTLGLVREISRLTTCCVVNASYFQSLAQDPFYQELLSHQLRHSDFAFLNSLNDYPPAAEEITAAPKLMISAINSRISYVESANVPLDHFFSSSSSKAPLMSPSRAIFQSMQPEPRENLSHPAANYILLRVSFQFSGTSKDLVNEGFWYKGCPCRLTRAKVVSVSDSSEPRMIAQFALQQWRMGYAVNTLGRRSEENLDNSTLLGQRLTASVVLRKSEGSMASTCKANFLKAMNSRVLSLCEI